MVKIMIVGRDGYGYKKSTRRFLVILELSTLTMVENT